MLTVAVTYFGQATVVYYWNTKSRRMKPIQTAD